jgi:hypothetical protein
MGSYLRFATQPIYRFARLFRNASETELERNLQRLDDKRQSLIISTAEGKTLVDPSKMEHIFEVFNEIGVAHRRYLSVVEANITREIYGLFGIAGTLAIIYHRSMPKFDEKMFDSIKSELGIAKHEELTTKSTQEQSKLLNRLDSLEQNLKDEIARMACDTSGRNVLTNTSQYGTRELLVYCVSSMAVGGVAAGLLLRGR